MEKKAKAEAKRARRKEMKESGGASDLPQPQDVEESSTGDESEMQEEVN